MPVSVAAELDAPLRAPALFFTLTPQAHQISRDPAARGSACPARHDHPPAATGCTPATPAAMTTARASDDASGGRYRAEQTASVGEMWSEDSGCTATVVSSDSGNVAVTAAHCVYHPTAGPLADGPIPPGTVYDRFIPGRAGDTAPYGIWPITMAWIDPRWRDTGDPTYDIAFLQLTRRNGHSIQDVVGAQGISFTPPPAGTAVTTLGYPANTPFDGQSLRRCSTHTITIDPTVWNALAMACAMNAGTSGGPWLTGFDPATGAGTVVGVSSVHEHDGPRLFARPIGEIGYALYRLADH